MHLKRLFTALLLSLLTLFTACETDPTPPDRYALVYGVSEYDETINYNGYYFPVLEYTDDDAVAMASLLEQKGYEVHLRLNNGVVSGTQAATKEQLVEDLTVFAASLSENDILVIYFSGHGTQSSPVGWDISNDEDQFSDIYDEYIILFQEDSDYQNHTVSDTYLYSLIKKLPSQKKIIIIDACQSGGFIGQEFDFDAISPDYSQYDRNSDTIFKSTLETFFHPKTGDIPPDNTIVISASGEQESSIESGYYSHGIFTYSLLYASETADYDGNGFIDTGELFRCSNDFFEKNWNSAVSVDLQYHPHISGGPVDFILFEAD